MRVAGLSVMFALIALLVSALLDLALWGGYQGFQPEAKRDSLLVVHAILHAAVFVVSGVAALVCFSVLRHRLPSVKAVSLLALSFGLIAPFAAVAATTSLGPVAGALTLMGVALFAAGLGGFALGNKDVG